MRNFSWFWSKLEFIIFSNWFNIFYTLYINFRSLPFKEAYKLPLFIYGFPRFLSLRGEMCINGKVRMGMIKINNTILGPSNSSVKTEIYNEGKIIFNGCGRIGCGVRLLVQCKGILDLGNDFKIMEMCNITTFLKVKIGNHSRIVHGSQIMDSNFHYIYIISTHVVNKYSKEIIIGDYNWVGNRTTITGGTITPNYTIVASNSLLNKNYLNIPEESIIGGIPAKLLSTGYRRVENKNISEFLNKYFAENIDIYFFEFKENMDKEEFSKIKY